MIRVPPTPPTDDPQWNAWVEKAADATKKLVEAVKAGKEPEISELYKAQKERILQLFHGKCAYCETLIVPNQPGDVDHFRPKKSVADVDGNVIEENGLKHPGYYWLAYNWRNLLPACERCNRPTKDKGVTIGKWDHFPVAGKRAFGPDEDLSLERPLLLNPLECEPSSHFKLDATGLIAGTTDEGKACVRILGLNRERLPEARGKIYTYVRLQFDAFIDACKRNDAESEKIADTVFEELEKYREGMEPYSAFGRLALADKKRTVGSRLARLLQPAGSPDQP